MARVPKELFTQFQEYYNNEQEVRDVSISRIKGSGQSGATMIVYIY